MPLNASDVSTATSVAYEKALRGFAGWLAGRSWSDHAVGETLEDTSPRPVRVVLDYITDMAAQVDELGRWRFAEATIRQTLAAINWDHSRNECTPPGADPIVRQAMKGIRESRQSEIVRHPLRLVELTQLVGSIEVKGDSGQHRNARDRCVILLLFAGSLLVQELTELRVCDVTWLRDGEVAVRIGPPAGSGRSRERTTLFSRGEYVNTCVPCSLARWLCARGSSGYGARPADDDHVCQMLKMSGDPEGALFPATDGKGALTGTGLQRSSLNSILKARARAAGIPAERVSTTTIRLGFIAEALSRGASPSDIARHCGHQSETAIRRIAGLLNLPLPAQSVTVGL